MTTDSYAITTIIINVLIFGCWIWLAIIKYSEGRSWHSYGCGIYAITYLMLMVRNERFHFMHNHILDSTTIMLSYFIYIGQLAASIAFIYYSLTKDHA